MLKYHFHPLSSYCWKGLIALYELGVPFEGVMIGDLRDPAQRAAFQKISPMGKMPAIEDGPRKEWETSIVIEYLDQRYSKSERLIPSDSDAALKVRQLDRFFDLYVHEPMQRIVGDHLRPADKRDPFGVERAYAQLDESYAFLNAELEGRTWAASDAFTLADCAAAPPLFYANVLRPLAGHRVLAAYFDRVKQRPSVARAIEEARPYFKFFPAGDIE